MNSVWSTRRSDRNNVAKERERRRRRIPQPEKLPHDAAEKNNVDQQVGDVVFLVEIRVLVPGDAGIPVDSTQKRLRIARGEWSAYDGDDGSGTFVEKWANIFDRCHASLGLGGMMCGIDAAEMGCCQRRRRTFDQASASLLRREWSIVLAPPRVGTEIDQIGGKRIPDRAQCQRPFGRFLGIRLVTMVRHKGKDQRQVPALPPGPGSTPASSRNPAATSPITD